MVNANAFADRLEKGLGDGLKLASRRRMWRSCAH